jgi:arylsulfatase A-like enzyme
MLVLFKPGLIRWMADKFIPRSSPIRKKVDKAVRAVAAYEKRKLYLVKALAIGFGVHVCTIGMYFCTSRAILEIVPSQDLFATGALMIGATVLPLSIAGIGMREGVFVFFLGPIAAIYAFLGYLVGEIISLLGGPVWLIRKGDYYEVMKTQRDNVNRGVDEDDEELEDDEAEVCEPAGPLPSIIQYGLTGLGAGLMAGLGVAIFDSVRLWLVGGVVDWSLPGYAAVLYGPFLAVIGAGVGAVFALAGRLVGKPRKPPIHAGTFIGFSLFSLFSIVIGFFFLQRDVFGEKASLFSPKLAGSVLALGVGLLVVSVVFSWLLRRVLSGKWERLGSPLFAIVVYVVFTGALVVLWQAVGRPSEDAKMGPAPKVNRPNVVLVMNDTHRADHVGAYGCEKNLTPRLDELAANGVVYNNAFAQASWTRPSVCTILTGRYPSSHTATLKGSVLPDEITTLAEALNDGGYETIGIATNFNMTPFFNVNQGFVDYSYLSPDQPFGSTDEQAKLIFVEVAKKISAKFRGNEESPKDYYVLGEVVTDEALARLDKRDKARPFFIFLSYMDVHDPYFRHPFDGYGISHRANPNPDPDDEALVLEMKELYAGEVVYWDTQFGRLVDGLKKRGIYDETLVVMVADHGEEFGEHGGFWHGTTLYDEQLKIPFIVKYPASSGISGGTEVSDWMRLLDVAPLILDNVGLEIPDEMQGAPAPQSARTPIFAEEDHQGNVLTSIRYADEGREIKLIMANEGNPRGLRPVEMYGVDGDPGETTDISLGSKKQLGTALKALDAAAAAARQGAAKAKVDDLSDEQKRVLKQLGYMKEGE